MTPTTETTATDATVPAPGGPSWEDLCQLAPYLTTLSRHVEEGRPQGVLLARNQVYQRPDGWCAQSYWARHVVHQTAGCVGPEIKGFLIPPELKTEKAFETAWDHLHALLPACSHAGSCRR